MPAEQILIGGTTAAMCVAGLFKQQWLLVNTRKGQRLVQCVGEAGAPWVLRLLCLLGIGFGVALAAGLINPLNSPKSHERPARPMEDRSSPHDTQGRISPD